MAHQSSCCCWFFIYKILYFICSSVKICVCHCSWFSECCFFLRLFTHLSSTAATFSHSIFHRRHFRTTAIVVVIVHYLYRCLWYRLWTRRVAIFWQAKCREIQCEKRATTTKTKINDSSKLAFFLRNSPKSDCIFSISRQQPVTLRHSSLLLLCHLRKFDTMMVSVCVWIFLCAIFRYNNNLNRLLGSCWMLKMWASWLFVQRFFSFRFISSFATLSQHSLSLMLSCLLLLLPSRSLSLSILILLLLLFSTFSFEILYD